MNATMQLTAAGREFFGLSARDHGSLVLMEGAGVWHLPEPSIDPREFLEALAGFSTYMAQAVLNEWFRGVATDKPGTVYVALNGSDPTDAGNNTELAIGQFGYARAAVSSIVGNWTAPSTAGSAEQISNSNNVAYNAPSGGDWNGGLPITWASLWDLASAGNMLASGALGTPRTILANDNAPIFGPTALVVSLA